MDFILGERRPLQRNRYGSVTGTIVEMTPGRGGGGRINGCIIFVSLEDENGNNVMFVVTPATYAVDFDTFSVGMRCTFWYDADAPMPLIYPPQYNAVAGAREKNGRMVSVGFFGTSLVNEEQTLQLNMDAGVEVRTTNNQYYQGSPANHKLVVTYETSTRSIPAQTTPTKVVVLCD